MARRQPQVSRLDEAFHCELVAVAGNREMARTHREVSEGSASSAASRQTAAAHQRTRNTPTSATPSSGAAASKPANRCAHKSKPVRKITLQRLQGARQKTASPPVVYESYQPY